MLGTLRTVDAALHPKRACSACQPFFKMLWAASVDFDNGEYRPGRDIKMFGAVVPDLELAHAVLVYDRETRSFVAAGIVTSMNAGVVSISIFRSWPRDTVTRQSLFALVRDPVGPTDAPRRNTIPEPKVGFARMAHSLHSPAYRAYALALEYY
jgi:hypothetical protein